MRSRARQLTRWASPALLAFAVGCGGAGGADWKAIAPTLESSCVHCHSASTIQTLLSNVRALPAEKFDATRFPDSAFPAELRGQTVEQIIAAGEIPSDATLDPSMPQRQAWILHELGELELLLSLDPAPDYSSEEKFNHFVLAGSRGSQEGCEMERKLEAGAHGEPEGMPPLWGPALFELLGTQGIEIDLGQRQGLRDYLDAILPGGVQSCAAGGPVSDPT